MPPEALHANAQLMSRVVAFMIRQGASTLFSIPPQLATDIRAYWARREVTGTQSSKKVDILNGEKKEEGESAEVNTVFSFVDRERTAQAHNSNPTEAALAQLYAHIRSLPESSEKRRLVKQFNKENGIGTPQQHYSRILNARGRSISDSIKKHLFHKGIKCTKNGVNQGHFNILQQTCGDKPNNSEKTPTPRLMMFQKSMDELSPLSKVSPRFSPPSSISSGDKEEEPSSHLSQRKLTFSDSPSSEKSCPDYNFTNTSPKSELIETSISPKSDLTEDITVKTNQVLDESHSERESSLMSDNSLEEMKSSKRNLLDLIQEEKSPFHLQPKKSFHCDIQNNDNEFLSPFKQPYDSEGVNWLPAPNSPYSYTAITDKHCIQTSQERDLVTSTPANHRLKYPPKLRGRGSIETSLLCHQTSCMLTPVTSDENNSMSPITRSTQKMSKAMQETMMTPRSRKPVLVLSGSNISHVPSFAHCSHIQTEEKQDDQSIAERNETPAPTKNTSKEESTDSNTEPSIVNYSEDLKHPSSESQNLSVGSCDEDSLTSTFIHYLQSRSVLTASPIDLSLKESSSGSPISLDLELLKSEDRLSDSLLYCLDGNIPSSSPNKNSLVNEEKKETCDSGSEDEASKRPHRPLKRKSSEIQRACGEGGSPMTKIIHHRKRNSLESAGNAPAETPKNEHVIETSL